MTSYKRKNKVLSKSYRRQLPHTLPLLQDVPEPQGDEVGHVGEAGNVLLHVLHVHLVKVSLFWMLHLVNLKKYSYNQGNQILQSN